VFESDLESPKIESHSKSIYTQNALKQTVQWRRKQYYFTQKEVLRQFIKIML